MLNKIKQLERVAKRLEPPAEERKNIRDKVIDYTENFLNKINTSLTYNISEDNGTGLYGSPIGDEPIDIDDAIRIIEDNLDKPGLNPASGGHLAYIPGGGIYPSALGDYIAAITNRYAGVFFAGPGAVRMENMLIEWMCNNCGYPKTAGGNLTSGGSLANLIAIVTARDAHPLQGKDYHKAVIYLTRQVHHSVDKSIRIAGLGEAVTRYIPMDHDFRMDTNALENAVQKDKKQGLIPWLIIASAGTTDTGAVDPISDIGDIAQKYKLWFHVDAAYGGFFILCDKGKQLFSSSWKHLTALNKADSIVVDPHKGLFLPYGSGAVLVKNMDHLYQSHRYTAYYMQDADKAVAGNRHVERQRNPDSVGASSLHSPADLSPELTKHFKGLRLWLPLKLFGLTPFKAALEEKILLARYFYEKIHAIDGFEVGPYPHLSVVIFRYVPASGRRAISKNGGTSVTPQKEEHPPAPLIRGDVNLFNEKLVEEIRKDGRVFLSSTLIDGKFYIRLAVLCFRTHLETIDLTISILQEKVKKLTI